MKMKERKRKFYQILNLNSKLKPTQTSKGERQNYKARREWAYTV